MEEKSRKRALLIVDVQPTFYEGGALACKGGNAVAERIVGFITEDQGEYVLLAITQDWHINPDSHFSDGPDFVDSWPPHGVVGIPETEVHDVIAALPVDKSMKKGQYAAAYSGFEGVNKDGATLEETLCAAEITEVGIVGVAESYCVRDTALDTIDLGWSTRVFSDLTIPVSEGLGQAAHEKMRATGIDQIPSDEAFTEIQPLQK